MITYLDTSVLLKLFVDDELGGDAVERLWIESEHIVCAEIGYAEARAALASAHRNGRLDTAALRTSKAQLDEAWRQITVVPVATPVVYAAGDLAESEDLRGYDAVHLAAAIAAHATVFATADLRLMEAAQRQGLGVSNPLQTPD